MTPAFLRRATVNFVMAKQAAKHSSGATLPSNQAQIVDPRWLLRTLGLLVVLALVCGYLTLGLLFYLGSWQLALRPTHDTAKGTGLASQRVAFSSGGDQVQGQWMPAAGTSTRASYAVLYLRGADGQLDGGDGTQIAALHEQGLGVLAFDYRGYGLNPPQPHPTEKRMLQDALAGWEYLAGRRGFSPDHIIIVGSGVGVSLGAHLLAQQNSGAALIGYNADSDVLARVRRDPRSHLFPVKLVFHERFSLDALTQLRQPKLLYSTGPLDAARTALYRNAADPKVTVEVPTHNARQEQVALSRFLDAYVPAGPTLLPIQ